MATSLTFILLYVCHAALLIVGVWLMESSVFKSPSSCCTECHYDLTGLQTGHKRCPECGDRIDLQSPGVIRRFRSGRMLAGILLAIVGVLGCCSGMTMQLIDRLDCEVEQA
jgi:hypothetical protein